MSKRIVGFTSLVGKDKVYVDADKVEALAYGTFARPSPINGATVSTAIVQLLGAGWQLVTPEKMDEVRRKLGWTIAADVEKSAEKVA
jgi:Holliday junction resolvase